jgi:hypothetical protein
VLKIPHNAKPQNVTRTFDYKFVVKSARISPMDEQTFRQFITERPALNLSALAEELGVGRVNFLKIVVGLRKIPRSRRGHFLSVAQKYGYRPENQE